jgi:hypothetical protein
VIEPRTEEPKMMEPGSTFRGSMSRGSSKDEGSYIYPGRHLLDRSFVLNSDSILIYWYSFTSNELYF